MKMEIAETFKRYGIEKVLDLAYQDPEKYLPYIMHFVDSISEDRFSSQRALVRKAIEEKDHPYHIYVRHLFHDLDPEIAKKLVTNIMIYAGIFGSKTRNEMKETYGRKRWPWVIGMSEDYDLEEMDDMITQGEEVGIFIYLIEEPLTEEVLDMLKEHTHSTFVFFTDGDHLDSNRMSKIMKLRNIMITLTKEKEETMALLKKKCVYFGLSSKTIDENWFEDKMNEGYYYLWYKTKSPDEFALLKTYRQKRPLLMVDESKDMYILENPHGSVLENIKNDRK
jgi:hypothetical protein